MALRGNLRDFSLPDVFQLVTFSKKTGVLRIRRSDGAEGSVWFRDGDVFFAQSNWHRDPLGQRMVAAQRITPNALSKALEMRAADPGGRRLGQILVDEGYVSDKVLEAFVQEQIQDTIFDLMRWDEGDFDFEAMPEVIEEDIGLSVSIENIVMEGARRLEEWTRIKKKVPSMDIVFKMATAPGEGTFEISLKPIEWQLLLLVDGTRSVSELAVETARTDFEVARIIYGLFSAGLLEIASDEEVERLRAERVGRDAKLESIRLETELTAKAKAARPAETPPAVETPPEEPEFLTSNAQSATAEDMAVFEQMMGAVLEAPAEEAAPEAPAVEEVPEAEAEPIPEMPEEPDVFAVMPEVPAEVLDQLPAELLEPSSALEVAPEAPLAEVPVEFAAVEEPPPAEPVAETPIAEESAAEGRAVEELEGPQITGDLERDLMALGLGELPASDLLLPSEPASVTPPETESEAEPTIAELEAAMTAVAAPDEAEPSVAQALEGAPEHELWAMPTQLEGTAEVAGEAAEEAPQVVDETAAVESEGPDFADLLSSLEAPLEDGLVEPPVEAGSGGVISTDAYLDEIGGMELGTGIGDELTALTGGGGGGRQRPQASVKKIPEAGEAGGLHMDQTVDKDLVLKIIDGIKQL